jgi:hypothetical protein
MLSVTNKPIMLIVVRLNVVMISVIMLSVVAPVEPLPRNPMFKGSKPATTGPKR